MGRLIDADVFKERLMANIGLTNCLDRSFKETPTIDAVEAVRCKDCMFSEVYQNDSSGVMGRFCEAFTQVRMVTDDDYCSYGERKETDHE